MSDMLQNNKPITIPVTFVEVLRDHIHVSLVSLLNTQADDYEVSKYIEIRIRKLSNK